MSKLTTKQKEFCDEYIKSGNTKDTVTKAGCPPRTAYSTDNENLSRSELGFYIGEQTKKLESKKIAGTREILEYLSLVMRGERIESVTTTKGVYDDVPVSTKDRISVVKEILKRYPVNLLGKTRLRGANVDARVTEVKAKTMEGNGQDTEQLLDKMLVSLDKADDRNSNN